MSVPNAIPTVSVVIPAYNCESTIERAIHSVMEQTYQPIEIVVVDDCSIDNTRDVIKKFGQRVLFIEHERNKNGAAARNTGANQSKGEYLAFLDSDDEFYPDKIEKQMHQIRSLSNKSGVASVTSAVNEAGESIDTRASVIKAKQLMLGKVSIVSTSALLVHRDDFLHIGGFDEKFRRHQDLEFCIRLAEVSEIHCIEEPLFRKNFTASPSFSVTQEAIKMFWKKFELLISQSSFADRSIMLGRGYRRLAELAFNERRWSSFSYYLFKLVITNPLLIFSKLSYYIKRFKTR